jgi:chromosome segregation ATPase
MCGASLESFEMISPNSEDYQSLVQQIEEARKRAEEFSKNIQKTRNTEYETMRNAEEERKKWAASYEEKTVMIEQLQRELASTVEALNHERKHKKSFQTSVLGNVTGIEHSLSHQRFMNSKHIPTMGSSRSPAPPPPPPSVPAPEGDGTKVSLPPVSHLNISQTIENNLRREITNLKIELEQTKNAWKDSETKITFYLSQIKQLETEINVQIQEKTHCQDRLKSLEKINLKVQTELNLMKSVEEEIKKSHEETVSELQQTIETLLSERERSDRIALTQDEEMRYLREQIGKSERDRKEWEENLKQLHRKEIELLEKQHQLQERERRPQDSLVLSPVASSRSTMVSRAVAPTPSPAPSSAGGNALPQNQTKVRTCSSPFSTSYDPLTYCLLTTGDCRMTLTSG